MVATAIAAAVALPSAPAKASAADADPFVLPGATPSAMVADIDGDGAREVLRLTGPDEIAQQLEVWDLVGDRWVATMSAELDTLPGIPPRSAGPPAVAFVRARVDGLERALLLIGGQVADTGAPGCCLAIHEVVDEGDGPVLREVPVADVVAESVVVTDLDGDGTDELAASLVTWSEDGSAASTDLAILGRDADGWQTLAQWEETGAWWAASPVETDGAPGNELLGTDEAGNQVRVAWIDGALAIDRVELRVDHEQAWVAGAVEQNLIVTSENAISLFRWPRDGQATLLASRETNGYASIGVVGSGADALVVVQGLMERGAPGSVAQVFDARLRPVGEVPLTAQAEALAELAERFSSAGWSGSPPRHVWPYSGPADGEVGGPATSYLVGGTLVTPRPGGSFEATQAASVVGQPIGRAGPEGGWVALADSYVSTGPIAYLQGGFFGYGLSRMTLVPLATFQDPTERQTATSVTFDGGISTAQDGEGPKILAAPSGVSIIVTVVPGTVAVSWDGTMFMDHGVVADQTLRLSVKPPSRPRPGREYSFERDLILIGPDGRATVQRWEGTFAPETPELSAAATLEALSLDATVDGRASPGCTVTVDGKPVAVNASGAYRATVNAPPWPRTVVVVARDPFGGEQRTTVQVIGLVDYRGLPWGPIAGVLTVLVGGVLFLRTPRPRSAAQRMVQDDAHLEDIDGDTI